MPTIAISDSGIGGLTTLSRLKTAFPFCDFYYLADNKNMPYGERSQEELHQIVTSLTRKLKAHGDIVVFACNTASQIAGDDVFRLSPPPTPSGSTLVLGTPSTINALKQRQIFKDERYVFAHTPELATLVETYVSVGVRKNCLNMRDALPYLAARLKEFKGVENVVLGCSHYLYLKEEIKRVLGTVKFFDGNDNLIASLKKALSEEEKHFKNEKLNHTPSVKFDFTADDQSTKYDKILKLLSCEF